MNKYFTGVFIASYLSVSPAICLAMDKFKFPITESTFAKHALSSADVKLYRMIFSLQRKGSWRKADLKQKKLEDKSLLGHVLAQRYLHPTKYRSKYSELADWLKAFGDHPDARRIYRLALKRKPRSARPPKKPKFSRSQKSVRFKTQSYGIYYRLRKASVPISSKTRNFHREVRRLVSKERLTLAGRFVDKFKKRDMHPAHISIARARISAGWFYYGDDRKTTALAKKIDPSVRHLAPLGWWYSGLAFFRKGEFKSAAKNFELLALTDDISESSKASASFWAARSNMIAKSPSKAIKFFKFAARHKFEFYGILAQKVIGLKFSQNWESGKKNPTELSIFNQHQSAQRALKLLQIGERIRAEKELDQLRGDPSPRAQRALLQSADALSMPRLAYQTARSLEFDGTPLLLRGLYPLPPWIPREGLTLDRALIFAFMRQESAFRTRARSPAGARGLMQLMPKTALYIGGRKYRARNIRRLYEPEININLGQKYLTYLIENELVGPNLLFLTAAYNAGPGNLKKWKKQLKPGADPLMFIESIPSRETRNFIERVIANFWIYRNRLGQPVPSLKSLAEGGVPMYQVLD